MPEPILFPHAWKVHILHAIQHEHVVASGQMLANSVVGSTFSGTQAEGGAEPRVMKLLFSGSAEHMPQARVA